MQTHLPRLLHERHAAVVKVDRVDHTGVLREPDQLPRLVGVHRERLFADDRLTRFDRRLADREMQMVRRAVVDDFDFGVVDQVVEVAVRLGNRHRVGLGPREINVFFREGDHLHVAKTPQRLDMRGANESGSDNADFDCFMVDCVLGLESISRDSS